MHAATTTFGVTAMVPMFWAAGAASVAVHAAEQVAGDRERGGHMFRCSGGTRHRVPVFRWYTPSDVCACSKLRVPAYRSSLSMIHTHSLDSLFTIQCDRATCRTYMHTHDQSAETRDTHALHTHHSFTLMLARIHGCRRHVSMWHILSL